MPPPKTGNLYSLAYRCSSCVSSSIPRRGFTSSATHRQTPAQPKSKPEVTAEAPTPTSQIPPESPRYIEIPVQKQIKAIKPPVIKGALPVPRDIFVTRSEFPKHTEEFIASVTRKPARETIITGQHVAKTRFKARMAKIRRQSLRVGIEQLHVRKEKSDLKWAMRGASRQAEQRALLSAPEPLDEQLTKTSIIKTVRKLMKGKHNLRTRNRRTTNQKRRNVAKKEKARAMERKDQLHTLYMHARDFIVTEEQLINKIDQVFGTEQHPADFLGQSGSHFGRSIWSKESPRNVSQMLGLRNRTAIKNDAAVATRERIQKIAEELTGGKI